MIYVIEFVDPEGRAAGRVTFEPERQPHARTGKVVAVEGRPAVVTKWAEVSAARGELHIVAGFAEVDIVPDLGDWLHVQAVAYKIARRSGRRLRVEVQGPTLEQIGIEVEPTPKGAVN